MATGAVGMAYFAADVSLQEQIETHSSNEDARKHSQKGVQFLRENILLRVERDRSEQIHARRMGDGHNQPKQEGMPRRALRPHQVGRDDCFAVSRLQCVQRAKSRCDEGRKERDANSDLLRGYELGECATRSLLTVGRDIDCGQLRRGHGYLWYI